MSRSLKPAPAVMLAALAGLSLIGCAASFSPATPDDPLSNWVGDYDYEELLGAGEEGENEGSINYHIIITEEGAGYVGAVSLNGFQTMQNLSAEVRGDADSITLVFLAYTGENMWQPYTIGDKLLTLTRQGDDLVTTWGAITPQLEQNQEPGLYFHGNVG